MWKEEIINPICPNCGEKESFKGSSKWNHNYSCCSDECGLELSEKLRNLYSSEEYKDISNKIGELKSELLSMEQNILKRDNNRDKLKRILYNRTI